MTADNVLFLLLCLKSNPVLFLKAKQKTRCGQRVFYLHLAPALGLLFTLYRTVSDIITMEHAIPAYLLGKFISVLLGF